MELSTTQLECKQTLTRFFSKCQKSSKLSIAMFWRNFSSKRLRSLAASPPNVEKSVRVAKLLFVGSLEISEYFRTSPFSPAERGGRWRPLWRNSRFFSPPFSFLFWFCFQFDYFHCVDRVKICRFHHFLADFKAVFGHFGPLKFHSSSVGFVKGIQDGRHGVVAAQSKSGALRQASARALSQQKGARSSGFCFLVISRKTKANIKKLF